ncbi:unnamed protein product [Eretmochelys imbricata]
MDPDSGAPLGQVPCRPAVRAGRCSSAPDGARGPRPLGCGTNPDPDQGPGELHPHEFRCGRRRQPSGSARRVSVTSRSQRRAGIGRDIPSSSFRGPRCFQRHRPQQGAGEIRAGGE